MATGATAKSLVDRRRRRRGSEDEESVNSDGGSEASVLSNMEHHHLIGSHASDTDGSPATAQSEHKDHSVIAEAPEALPNANTTNERERTNGTIDVTTAESDTRTNGSAIARTPAQAQVEDSGRQPLVEHDPVAKLEGVHERRHREQEEYRKKREGDPTFIPNRGNFFMHDPRAPDQRGFVHGAGRGRGRGRGQFGGPLIPSNAPHSGRAAESPWTHDLHESVNEPDQRSSAQPSMFNRGPFPHNPAAAARAASQPEYKPYSFSRSKLLGNVQVKVALPGMKEAVPFTGVPVKQHTRLPDHRPPLRRDKPVRVSLPDRPPRYIFPSQERSFIFIPRALRPNQQGYGRPRAGFGPSSRRTSAYGGSVYEPSVAASRRSSIARDIGREHMFSPAASVHARQAAAGRPVVRLPFGMSQPGSIASPAGSVFMGPGPGQPFPLPQTPLAEHYRDAATMHQPRPQKTISVSGIDSPAALSMHAPQQLDQQPFENQIPQQLTEGGFVPGAHPSSHYPYHAQSGTPLSHIPERAIHAQPFQPPMGVYNQSMYGQYAAPGYYYPPVPVFVPPTGPQTSTSGQETSTQAGPMAHESNGMVYYLDPNQVQNYAQSTTYAGQDGYLQADGYPVSGAVGMVNPNAEAAWFYQGGAGTVYYPQGQ